MTQLISKTRPIRYTAFDNPDTLVLGTNGGPSYHGGEELAVYCAQNHDKQITFYADLCSFQGVDYIVDVENSGKRLFCQRYRDYGTALDALKTAINKYRKNMGKQPI